MRSKKTLYDLLEVSPHASAETIREAWTRYESRYNEGKLQAPDGLDGSAYFNLLKDAWFTLGDADRRAAYDSKLAGASTRDTDAWVEAEPGMSGTTKLVLVGIAIGVLVLGYRWHIGVERERVRQRTEQVRLEQMRVEQDLAEREREEARRLRNDAETDARQAENEARQQRYERERAIADADRNDRRLQAAEDRYRREDERARYIEERERRQKELESQRALRELERKARNVDSQYDRGRTLRGGGIPLQGSSSSSRY